MGSEQDSPTKEDRFPKRTQSLPQQLKLDNGNAAHKHWCEWKRVAAIVLAGTLHIIPFFQAVRPWLVFYRLSLKVIPIFSCCAELIRASSDCCRKTKSRRCFNKSSCQTI